MRRKHDWKPVGEVTIDKDCEYKCDICGWEKSIGDIKPDEECIGPPITPESFHPSETARRMLVFKRENDEWCFQMGIELLCEIANRHGHNEAVGFFKMIKNYQE